MDEAARDGKPELPDVDDTMPDLDHELAEEEQDPGAADEPVEQIPVENERRKKLQRVCVESFLDLICLLHSVG